MGGDEFAVFVPGIEQEDAKHRLILAGRNPQAFGTVSPGIKPVVQVVNK